MNSQLMELSRRRIRAGARRGYAMLVVMILILTTTALAAVHQRHLSAALRIEQARVESETYAQGPLTVLAIAIDRLKTGDPPMPVDYSFEQTVAGVTNVYQVSYSVSGTQWIVTADPIASAGLLPPLPAAF